MGTTPPNAVAKVMDCGDCKTVKVLVVDQVSVWLSREITKVTEVEPAVYWLVAAALAETTQDPALVQVSAPVLAFTVQPLDPALVTA